MITRYQREAYQKQHAAEFYTSLQACLRFLFEGEIPAPSPDAQLSMDFWYACPLSDLGRGPAPLSTYEHYSDYTRVPIIR